MICLTVLLFVKAGVDGAKAEADATKRAEKAAVNFIVWLLLFDLILACALFDVGLSKIP